MQEKPFTAVNTHSGLKYIQAALMTSTMADKASSVSSTSLSIVWVFSESSQRKMDESEEGYTWATGHFP